MIKNITLKSIKILSFTLVMFLIFSINSFASEIDPTSEYFQELMQNEDYRDVYNTYEEMINYLNEEYQSGGYTEEEYNFELNNLITSRNDMLNSIEQEILRQKQNDEEERKAAEFEQVEGFADQIGVTDQEGKTIKDYTNIDFSNFPNKRVLTIKGNLADGTTTKSDFYVKVNVSARNVIYDTSAIMDKSNDYTVSIPVPNDVYYVYYEFPETEDFVDCEEELIDARLNPLIEYSIIGAIRIDSNMGELILIEGEEYVEEVEIEENTINWKLITIIGVSVILIGGLTTGIVIVIKKKKENEI